MTMTITISLKKTGIGNKPKNDLASYLIESGADPTIKNNEGLTSIDIALQNTKKNIGIIKIVFDSLINKL